MKILIACEYSGVVRDAFRKKGHDAWSCDLLSCDSDSTYHYQEDVLDVINDGWDMMIAHPPCTFLSSSGSAWFYHPDDKHLPIEQRRPHPKFPNRREDQENAYEFFMKLARADIKKIAVENPIGVVSTLWRKPDQIIQPWMFGEEASKSTCLWLKNLPKLIPTKIVGKGDIYFDKSGKKRARWFDRAGTKNITNQVERMKERSKTFQGIADAMANQWGNLSSL
jgi:hypothetical protein